MVSLGAVLDAITKLNDLANRGCNVVLIWIKAHVNHEGNERADVLTKRGTDPTDLTTHTPSSANPSEHPYE